MCYDLHRHRVVTSSMDGKFKIWENTPIETEEEEEEEEGDSKDV